MDFFTQVSNLILQSTEFLMSIIEDRKPRIDEVLGGNITAAGICAHASAMQDGKEVEIPLTWTTSPTASAIKW